MKDVQAKPAWKHEIENEQIVIKAQCLAFDICSVVDNVGGVTFFLQTFLYETRNFPVVFRDQYPHDNTPQLQKHSTNQTGEIGVRRIWHLFSKNSIFSKIGAKHS